MVNVTLERLLEIQNQAEQAYKIIAQELRRNKVKVKSIEAYIFPGIKTVGIKGDTRVYQYPLFVSIRRPNGKLYLNYDVLGKISSRIVNEVKEITRVVVRVGSRNSPDKRTNAEVDYERENLVLFQGKKKYL